MRDGRKEGEGRETYKNQSVAVARDMPMSRTYNGYASAEYCR